MHITQSAKVFKVFARNNIYVINQIIFDIDKVALISSVMIINKNELI